MHAEPSRSNIGKEMLNEFREPTLGIDYNLMRTFVETNAFGTNIYHDPMERYLANGEDHPTPSQLKP